MISVAEALERLIALTRPVGVEIVGLAEAGGRVLAAPVRARRTQPPFAASSMDGYAVAAGAAPGDVLRVIGQSAAGRRFDGRVGPGEAVRIFTGAPVPEGAERVVIQEDVRRDGDRVALGDRLEEATNIRPAGLDFRKGDEMEAPRRLSPADIALLAAMNAPEVEVRRRPKVALIPTGDELVPPGGAPGPDQIVSSNNYGLAAMLAAAGAAPELHAIARDDAASLRAALDRARGTDLIVTLGGASVGDHDLVQDVFAGEGLDLAFYKVAMRPGKPLMAGRIGGRMMVGLPGNPVSAMVCGRIFLRPVIDALLGLPAGAPPRELARLVEAVPANGPREHYARAVATVVDGEKQVRLFDRQDSSILSLLSAANCLAVLPPNAPARRAGETVEIIAI